MTVTTTYKGTNQNDDGSPHDKHKSQKGKIPKWINEYLKENEGWDYNGNRNDFFNKTTLGGYESGYVYEYADGARAYEEMPKYGYLELPGHIRESVDEYEDLYFTGSNYNSSFCSNSSTVPIVVVPSGPIVVPELPMIPVIVF